MPKRSNLYQRLVVLMHSQLGSGWSVEESKALPDARTGQVREVDIVATAIVGGYPLIISVEVRDRSRPADVTWVEEMAQKHADLPTSKLALWSPSGFTMTALTKAHALNIETVSPEDLDSAPWASIGRNVVGGSIKYVRPTFTPVVDVRLQDGSIVRWDAPADMMLTAQDGSKSLLLGAILQQISDSPNVRTLMLDHAPEGTGDFYAIYKPPFPCVVQSPTGAIGELDRVVIGIRTECEIKPVAARTAVRNRTATTLVEASVNDGILQLVAEEPIDATPNIRSRLIKRNDGSA